MTGYSSTVSIHLTIAGKEYEVAQIGRDSLILREPVDLPAGSGLAIITVDGKPIEHRIEFDEHTGTELRFRADGK